MTASLDDVLVLADVDDAIVTTLHEGGCSPEEIAERVSAWAGSEVAPGSVTAWLHDHGYPPCTAIYGPAMCEQPSIPGSVPPRCHTCTKEA
ncbi:hypothetical protein H9L10_03695 [Phycicoccus endophyticus]|uniref:Uncharacterized protein n=1 Tax=Phycicoccus endophyticus TaxID=1690220 RepID=A0A7G9R3J7_9MICO|nr:hypothetical protein [Phycicoccus endophyticus]NHI19929.1 hypothetical protein [Phycicoccus endophyticus]QNN50172.1 hypothetical protein H9L10_03695 [Phycicoccus endophyticus]GGL27462.1 hypothetical protein GCM10012283_07040 [Phycicoccus endophyticus]